jgi:nucleotide-binding universal stress UspA family protein
MKILIAYDGSIPADAAIEDLRRAGLPQQAEARIVCVCDGNISRNEAERLAESAGERIRSYFPNWSVSTEGLRGAPAKIILGTADSWFPHVIVAGSHGHSGFARLFLGSVSLALIHKATCSVRVARIGGSSNPLAPVRIVIGNDGSASAEAVIRSVAARSWPENSEARIVAVVQTLAPVADSLDASTYAQEPAYSVIREADERMRFRLRSIAAESVNVLRRAGLRATSAVIDGDPREVILDEAERCCADAIFVGARGTGRIERLILGSVSSHIVTHAHCTVEVVRGCHD